MFNFLKKNKYQILLIFLSLTVYHKWFFTLGIIKNGDWGYYYKDAMISLNIYWFSMWLGDFYGRVLFDVGQAPTYALYGYLAKYLNFDFVLSERIIYLWPVALFTPLSSYFLLREVSLNKVAAFVGAIVYTFNTYFLVLQTGHMTLMGAFAIAPFVVATFIRALNKLTFFNSLIAGITLSIQFAYEPRSAYITLWILLFYLLYFIFFMQKKIRLKYIIKIIFFACLPVFLLGLLNIGWITALLLMRSSGVDSVLGRQLFGNSFYNILYSLTLFHPFWTGGKIAVFNPQPIPFFFWLIPFFAILGLFLNRKNKFIIFFGIIALLGIFLSKQIGSPFQHIYLWLYTYFPGFNAFREASKFYFLVALGYSVLIAAFTDWLWNNWINNKLQIYGKYLICFIIVGIFLWNTKPLITGEYETLFITKEINKDYLIVKDYIARQQEYFRTLWAPHSSHFSYYSTRYPLAEWVFLQNISKLEMGEQKIQEKLKPGEVQVRLLNKPYANALLDMLSVKYIIIPIKDNINDFDPFVFQLKDKNYYVSQLDKISYLSKIDIATKDIVVYENNGSRSHIYVTSNQESIRKNQPFKKVDYKFINPTTYKISLTNVKESFYLNFSESYHPDWRIYPGDFQWHNIFFNKQEAISDIDHIRNDAGLNSYFLDSKSICKKFSCVQNKDGTYDINLTLYFTPQGYMYLGLIITGTTLIVVFGYLSFIGVSLIKQKYGKKN